MAEDRIGFVGLGNMGGRMTRRIVDAGREVFGYDVVAEQVRAAGASPAASVTDLVGRVDAVLLSLPDSTVVEQVMLGDGGIIAGLREGQLVVDLSTASPESTRRIEQRVRDAGGCYLDAGITGGAAAAEQGELTLMVGGDPDALVRIRPVLELFAKKIFHCGGSGAGHTAKLLNNFLNAIALAGTAEVMVAGKKAGLDLAVLLEVFNNGSGVNFATLNRFPKIIKGDYLRGGLTNTLMHKDVVLYTELLGRLGVPSLNAAGPLACFGTARLLGYADQISNTVVDAIGDLAGGVRVHDASRPERDSQ